MALSDSIADRLIELDVDLSRTYVSINDSLLYYLISINRQVLSLVSELEGTAGMGVRDINNYIKTVEREIDTIVENNFNDLYEHFIDQTKKVVAINVDQTANGINESLGGEALFAPLGASYINSVIENTLIGGDKTKDLYDKQRRITTDAYMSIIRNNSILNESPSVLTNRVSGDRTGGRIRYTNPNGDRLSYPDYSGGVISKIKNQLGALSLTSYQAILNSARFQSYLNNGNLILGYQALVVLDNRTSNICKSLSGMAWYRDGSPFPGTTKRFPGYPPYHFRCRTTLIPIFNKLDALGISSRRRRRINESGFSDLFDGQPANDLSYDSFLRSKSAKYQLSVLGRGRYNLWKAGNITTTELTNFNATPLTVTQLIDKYNSNTK